MVFYLGVFDFGWDFGQGHFFFAPLQARQGNRVGGEPRIGMGKLGIVDGGMLEHGGRWAADGHTMEEYGMWDDHADGFDPSVTNPSAYAGVCEDVAE